MRENFKRDKRQKEEQRRKKQEEKRNRRLHKKDAASNPDAQAPVDSSADSGLPVSPEA